AGDNLAGALGNAAAPYLATEIKRRIGEDNPAANVMAHAVLGAVTAQLNGQSPLAGGLGAGGGELAARVIARQLFPGKDPDALSETEKQQVSALSQLAAGIAGGLSTGDAAGGVTGAQAGRNAVENNNLNAPQLDEFAERARGCGARGDCHQVIEEMERLSVAQQDRLISVCATDPNACRKEYGDIPANSMLIRDAIDRVLGDSDIPWQMKADMGPLLSQQIDAEGVVSSTEFAERLARTYG
ncbi:VENN motif pre-toxin domain-containing protein, partial [Achromobacter xylosoxidans]